MALYSIFEQIKTVDDLLALNDAQFLTAAYRRVLGREPDATGHAAHLHGLRQGRPKLAVLRDFVRSDEGRSKVIDLPGLDQALRRYDARTRSAWARWRFRHSFDYGRSRFARSARAEANRVAGLENRVSTRLEDMEQMLEGLVNVVRSGALPMAGPAIGSRLPVARVREPLHAIRSSGLNARPVDLPGAADPLIARLKL